LIWFFYVKARKTVNPAWTATSGRGFFLSFVYLFTIDFNIFFISVVYLINIDVNISLLMFIDNKKQQFD